MIEENLKETKDWECSKCHCQIEVYKDYEPEYCCPGRMQDECGCMGMEINPVFCAKCEVELGLKNDLEEEV